MNNEQTVKWYGKKLDNVADQGLVIDEKTGENIAVCYNNKHVNLIAAAPSVLSALKDCVEQLGLYLQSIEHGKDDDAESAYKHGLNVIAMAEEV